MSQPHALTLLLPLLAAAAPQSRGLTPKEPIERPTYFGSRSKIVSAHFPGLKSQEEERTVVRMRMM